MQSFAFAANKKYQLDLEVCKDGTILERQVYPKFINLQLNGNS